MASYVEIDPDDFVKALRMLHSRTPESSDELKRLLDSYYERQINSEAKKSKDFTNVFSAIQSLNQEVKSDSERRTRASEDDSEATDIEDNEITDTSDFANDFGLSCVVCKQIEITTNNQLFECNECKNLYHQECHKPPITKKEINDPRFVWYCSKCNKNVKKVGKPIGPNKLAPNKPGMTMGLTSGMNSSSPTASSYSINYPSIASKEPNSLKSQPNFMKISESENKSISQQPFKRGPGKFFNPSYSANAKSSASSLSSVNRPSSATLAANKGKVISSSSSSNSVSSFSPINALQTLDKRFPSLKKNKMTKYN